MFVNNVWHELKPLPLLRNFLDESSNNFCIVYFFQDTYEFYSSISWFDYWLSIECCLPKILEVFLQNIFSNLFLFFVATSNMSNLLPIHGDSFTCCLTLGYDSSNEVIKNMQWYALVWKWILKRGRNYLQKQENN